MNTPSNLKKECRWWEARTLWGRVYALSRNLARQAAAWFPPEQEAALLVFGRWAAALGYILAAHLDQRELDPAGAALLLPAELALLRSWGHGPDCAAQVLSSVAARALPADSQAQLRAAMDANLSAYILDMGGCERIQRTCLPMCYTRHLSRTFSSCILGFGYHLGTDASVPRTGFMLLWCTFLPFALWDICGWASPVVEGVLTFLLLGIENVGIQIEEPFHILPMRAYCAGMAADVGEIVARRRGLEGVVEVLLLQGKKPPFTATVQ